MLAAFACGCKDRTTFQGFHQFLGAFFQFRLVVPFYQNRAHIFQWNRCGVQPGEAFDDRAGGAAFRQGHTVRAAPVPGRDATRPRFGARPADRVQFQGAPVAEYAGK